MISPTSLHPRTLAYAARCPNVAEGLDGASAYPCERDRPDIDATSGLSDHLAVSEISLRTLWAKAALRAELSPAHAAGIGKFLSELIWREFFWHLLIDQLTWLAHFADCVTDWDPAANAMNWQWVAGCGTDAAPYFRIFNPEWQAEQYDPDGGYRRRWLAGFDRAAGSEAVAWTGSIPRAWDTGP